MTDKIDRKCVIEKFGNILNKATEFTTITEARNALKDAMNECRVDHKKK